MSQTRDWFCGHLRAIGRGKDVIIRGGDNIPVVEVESLLCRHPANAMAAIVAYPDERLGERLRRGGAKPGQAIDPPRLVQILKDQKIAVQYITERLIVRDAMRSPPSGTIQKFKHARLAARRKPGHRHLPAIGLQTSWNPLPCKRTGAPSGTGCARVKRRTEPSSMRTRTSYTVWVRVRCSTVWPT